MRVALAVAMLVVALGLLVATVPVQAHHAFAATFDTTKPVVVHCVITKVELINPHSWFHINVKELDGTVTEWMIEGGTPNSLMREGVTKNTLPFGIALTIEGYQAKNGTNTGVGRNFVLADGRRLFIGSPSTAQPKSAAPDAQHAK